MTKVIRNARESAVSLREPRQSSGAEAPRANRAASAILNIQNETEDDESHPLFRGAATQSISEFFAASISEKHTVLLPSLKLNVIVSLSSNR